MYKNYFKSLLDFLFAFAALVLLSPLLIVVTFALTLANKGNPLFLQRRPGKGGKIFTIVKFKTMTDEKDNNGELLEDSQRLTVVGQMIRRTSIDEIPQLFNVLKGDMSLIGPRPLLPEYLPLYSEEQKQRHEVRPGITGWAQVNGRNTISWDQKFKYDVWYVKNLSFSLDIKIIFLTIKKVLRSADVAADNHVSLPKFSDELQNKNQAD